MAGLPFSGLRARLVVLVLVAVLPALALALHAGIEERRAAGDRVRDDTLVLTRLASANHERLVELTQQFLATLTQVPEIRQGRPAACDALLGRLLHQHPIYADLGLLSPQGQFVCSGLPPLDLAEMRPRPFFRRVLETRSFAVGDIQPGGIPPRPTLAFGYPVFGERGTLQGVVYALLDLAWLQEFAETAKTPSEAVLFLMDGKGTVLAQQPAPRRGVAQPSKAPIVQTILRTRGEGVAQDAGLDGVRRLFAFAPLATRAEGTELYVGVGVPLGAAYAEANRRLVRTLAAVGIAGLLSIFAAWAAGDLFIVRRVKALLAATTGLAAGDLAIRTGLAGEPGALGQLAREFDDMAATLERRQAEMDRTHEELRKSEARKGAILEGALDSVITMDAVGQVVEFNPAAEKTFGYAREEAMGRPVDELIVPPRLRGDAEAALGPALARGDASALRTRVERVAMRADGTEFPVEVSVTPIEGEASPLYTAFLRDITVPKQAEAALRDARDELQKRVEARTTELKEANERLVDWVEELQQRAQDMRLLSETGDHLQACHSVDEAYAVIAQYGGSLFPDEPGALFMLNPGHNLVECVASWGTPPPAEEVFSPDDCWALRRGRPHVVEGPDAHLVCRHVGLPAPAAYVCVPLMAQSTALGVLHLLERSQPASPGGAAAPEREPASALGPQHVLARRQLAFTVADQVALALSNLRLQESLRDQAIRDPLTGLFNRRYMEESLERELRRARRRSIPLGVIMIDIDHFKRFNDTFGHAAGDTLLREIGTLLQHHTRGEDIACRYGGEEFTLILLEASADDTGERARRLREEAGRLRVEYGHQPLGNITISAGVAVFPEHGHAVEELLKAADAALYRAKAGGRDRVMVAAVVS
jgi:diguanylate cyclase (GGDEF)-like protein/PAS domain S-box-containing protein